MTATLGEKRTISYKCLVYISTGNMGLDVMCECGFFGFKLGSYGEVQRLRARWILAEALRQEHQGHPEKASEMRSVVVSDTKIDYRRFRKIQDWLPGTVAFVDHSDVDGYWCSAQVLDIHKAIQDLKECFLEVFEKRWFYEEDNAFFLEDLFAHCAERREVVELM